MRRGIVIGILSVLLLSGCGPVMTVQVVNPSAAATTAQAEASAAAVTEPNSESCKPPTQGGSGRPIIPGSCAAESILSTLVTYLTFMAELAGAIVIAVAVIRGLFRFIPYVFRRQSATETYTEDIRLQIGKSLALALEFELGADILKTAVAPTLAIIAQLAAIAVLRTFLNYFLEQELRKAEQRRAGEHLAEQPRPDSSKAQA